MRGVATAIIEMTADKSEAQLKELMPEIVAYLGQHNLLNRWRDIEQEIHEGWRKKFGVSRVTVASAHPLAKEVKTALEKASQGAELITIVDERLMGGAVVRIDERRIDGSVLGALTRLKQTLLS